MLKITLIEPITLKPTGEELIITGEGLLDTTSNRKTDGITYFGFYKGDSNELDYKLKFDNDTADEGLDE